MPYQLIAHGSPASLSNLRQYQNQFEENSQGYLELQLRSPVANNLIESLDEKLETAGVVQPQKIQVIGRNLLIHFQTRIAPLVIIAIAIAASIIILALLIAWKLWKLRPAVVLGFSLLTVAVIVGLGIVLLWLISRTG